MTFYLKPSIHQIISLPILSRMQASGQTPLIPECNGNATADCAQTASLGIDCCLYGNSDPQNSQVYISVLVQGSTCSPNPACTIDQLFEGSTALETENCSLTDQTVCSDGCLMEFTCEYASGHNPTVCTDGPSSFSASITCDGQPDNCTPQSAT